MLTITVPAREMWDEDKEEFIKVDADKTLILEHSLVSISKWEAKWCKPFLGKEPKTRDESIDYIRCMTINKNVDPVVYYSITNELLAKVQDYIDSPMTATTFRNLNKGNQNGQFVTSELIYYWMTSFNIPAEYQTWHLNRLLVLIRICSEKNSPSKKMGRKEAALQRHAINRERCSKMHTRG